MLLAGLFGAFFGFLYGVSGFKDPGDQTEFAQNPRVLNALWLLGGALAVFFGNWEAFTNSEISSDVRLAWASTYMIAAVLIGLLTIACIGVMLFLSAQAREKDGRLAPGDTMTVLTAFLASGQGHAQVEQARLEAREKTAVTDKVAEVCKAISLQMATRANPNLFTDSALREDHIDRILSAMEATVKLYGPPKIRLNSNYMVSLKPSDVPRTTDVKFRDQTPNPDRCLMVKRYKNGSTVDVCIPVAKTADRPKLLPGAPTAYVDNKAALINCKNIQFANEVAAPVRDAVNAFFATANYASVLSVPLIWEREIVGIANIESNEVDLVGRGADILEQIEVSLSPFCLLLGETIKPSRIV